MVSAWHRCSLQGVWSQGEDIETIHVKFAHIYTVRYFTVLVSCNAAILCTYRTVFAACRLERTAKEPTQIHIG